MNARDRARATELARIRRAMRQACRIGVDPLNSHGIAAELYRAPWLGVRAVHARARMVSP